MYDRKLISTGSGPAVGLQWGFGLLIPTGSGSAEGALVASKLAAKIGGLYNGRSASMER